MTQKATACLENWRQKLRSWDGCCPGLGQPQQLVLWCCEIEPAEIYRAWDVSGHQLASYREIGIENSGCSTSHSSEEQDWPCREWGVGSDSYLPQSWRKERVGHCLPLAGLTCRNWRSTFILLPTTSLFFIIFIRYWPTLKLCSEMADTEVPLEAGIISTCPIITKDAVR